MQIKNLIFDFDGIIFDTETILYKTMAQVFNHFGKKLQMKVWCDHFHNFDPYSYLEELVGSKLDRDELQSMNREIFGSMVSDITPRPGVEEWFQLAKSRDLKLAVASNADRFWIDMFLTRQKLSHYFDVICSKEDVKDKKPSPEIYLMTLKRLNTTAEESIAFEDAPNGLTAAIKANIRCVVVTNEITKHLSFEGQYKLTKSFEDFHLDQLFG